MRLWIATAAVAALAACAAPEFKEPLPDPIEIPAIAPAAVMRLPVEFSFTDARTGKEYFFRRFSAPEGAGMVREDRLGGDKSSIATYHEDGEIRLEVVTVLMRPGGDERLATAEERAYALGVLQEDWVKRGREEMMTYHSDASERERRVRADLLDDRIMYRESVLADLRRERMELKADHDATIGTPGYQVPRARLDFLKSEIARHDVTIASAESTLALMHDVKRRRDTEIGRSSAPLRIREWIPVKDLTDRARISPDRLISEIRSNVRPESWRHPNSVIRHLAGHLEVANSRAAIEETHDYLKALRTRVLNGER